MMQEDSPPRQHLLSCKGVSSVYIHIPFCIKKCKYCDFFSVPFNESAALAYSAALCRELQLKSRRADALKTIYIGGGTPTVLPDGCFRRIFECLRDNYHISPYAEISVEANPGTLGESKVGLLLSLGANRISLGVQSFDDGELGMLGRIHTADDAIRSLRLLQRSGLKNISADFMYGIPGQSIESWKETIEKALEFSPAHISAYELTPEAGTPLFNKIRETDEDLILKMYSHGIERLSSKGFQQYEISNFAQPDFKCLHNLNYWNRGGYIGAGAGAHSFVRGVRSSNIKHIDGYIERLNGNLPPDEESTEISPEDAVKEFLFLGLRKTDGISLSAAQTLGLDVAGAGRDLINMGHLEIKGDSLRLTRRGTVISNSVIAVLLSELDL